ncbi:MAG TPA: metal-sensitive transcriptional regulator [Nocardioides sp.]|nr:metal-sensitive transcriptional regulator [Nocardioides sp.]
MTTGPVHVFHEASAAPGYATRKRDHLNRLTKVEGQVRGVARMVDEERYCIDVLVQIAAATKALQQVALGLLDEHMRNCVSEAVRSSTGEADQKLAEVNRAVALALRL